MPLIRIPLGTTVKVPQPLTREALEQTLFDLCDPAHDFTGFIAVRSDTSLYLLFIFNSRPYSAGKTQDEAPSLLTIHDFFREIGLLAKSDPLFSVHATDPVLFKSLLVFMHDNLAARAPASLINLEELLEQIRREEKDSVIVLEKRGMLNFFFYKDGVKGRSYYADRDAEADAGLSIDEQVLLYASQGDEVDALVYRNTATPESTEPITISLTDMLNLLCVEDEGSGIEPTAPATESEYAEELEEVAELEVIEEHLLLYVLDGSLKEKTMSAHIPCVIGRRETDIILPDPMVSKTHAAIQVVNGKLLLIDLNSTNGTTVNGQRIKQHEIREGDIVGIAGIHLKVIQIRQF